MTDKPAVLAKVAPSPGRRGLALAMLFFLGGLLVYLGIVAPFAAGFFQLFITGLGLGALYLGERTRRSTMHRIELTCDALRSTDGRVLCHLDAVEAVDRGPFALKPSNGFSIRLKDKAQRTWQPGLWWRFGRRIGIGGVTPAHEGKLMADVMSAYLKDGKFPFDA